MRPKVASPRFDEEPYHWQLGLQAPVSSPHLHPAAQAISRWRAPLSEESGRLLPHPSSSQGRSLLHEWRAGVSALRSEERDLVPMGTLLNIVAEGETSCITFHFLPSVHLCARPVPRASKKEELPAPRFA